MNLDAILPEPTKVSEPFWDGCQRGELLLQRCGKCRKVFFYPRICCPECGGQALGWTKSRGRGRIVSYTKVFVSFNGTFWQSQLPYTVLLIDLEEGPRMLSRLVGPDEGMCSGAEVEVEFVRIRGTALPYFRLAV